MTLPAYAEEFRGLPACPCQVAWIPVFEAHCRRVIPGFQGTLAIAQMIGLYEGSGNTHGDPNGQGLRKGGGFTDFWVTGSLADSVVREARQAGAPATWHRPRGWDNGGGSEHDHSGLEGCPHSTIEGLAQIAAVYNGGDGLVGDAPDPGPKVLPVPHRTWQEGIEWMKEQELMAAEENILQAINAQGEASKRRDVALRGLVKNLSDMVGDVAETLGEGDADIKKRITTSRRKIEAAIEAADQD